jgi:hypothetical protein
MVNTPMGWYCRLDLIASVAYLYLISNTGVGQLTSERLCRVSTTSLICSYTTVAYKYIVEISHVSVHSNANQGNNQIHSPWLT